MYFDGRYKKIIIVNLLFISVISIIAYSVYTVNNHINSVRIISESVLNTSTRTLENIKSAVFYSENDYSSYDLKFYSENKTDSLFSGFSLSNDNKDKNIALSVNDLKLGNYSAINISAYADSAMIGFKINDNPELCYTAKSMGFKSTWNNSVYSWFFDVPSFIPNDLTYNEINKLLASENIFKIFMALNFEDFNIDTKELINNIDISDLGTYPVNIDKEVKEGKLFRINIAKNYIQNIFACMIKSASASKMKMFSSHISSVDRYFEDITGNTIAVDLVLYENFIYSAETSIKTKNSNMNIFMKITDEIISITAKELTSCRGDEICLELEISVDDAGGLKASLANNVSNIASFNIKKKGYGLISSSITYLDNNYKLILSKNIPDTDKITDGKNIYKLSVSDLYLLYRNVNK